MASLMKFSFAQTLLEPIERNILISSADKDTLNI
jgi:hypothetical protein